MMRYYIMSNHPDTEAKIIGPFNTWERASAYKKKYHIWGTIFGERYFEERR